MAESRLSKTLAQIKPEELEIDELGRVVITNPRLVREIGRLKVPGLGSRGGEFASDSGCTDIGCTNTGCALPDDLRGDILGILKPEG
jgi:hypothetical protein